MPIRQTPTLFLSLLLCFPVLVSAATKSVSPNPQHTVKVQPIKQGAKTTAARQYPRRGMTMQQVRKQYGQPRSVRRSTGKVKKQWPRITVWNYGSFSVYFERHITLHTVVH
ncbi:MAG: hypothetical protein CSA79_04085 [Thiothrix nivea]|nr:MAG: hypothetical protein CSA79_04085 [Thiothrix nivea]